MSTMVRISEHTKEVLQELSAETKIESHREIVEMAVDAYQRNLLLELANQSYAALQQNAQLQQRREQEKAARAVLEQDRLEREQTRREAAEQVEYTH